MRHELTFFLIGFLLAILAASAAQAESKTPFLEVEPGYNCPNLFWVRFADLDFYLLAIDDRKESRFWVQLIAPPLKFFLLNRGDLVGPLEWALQSSQGRDSAVARLIACWFLPYIDSWEAAKFSLSIPNIQGPSSKWNLALSSSQFPTPVDATTPKAWTRHIGNPAVLDTITRKLRAEEEGKYPIPWSLALLGNSNSPEALKELRAYFERNPQRKALGAEQTLWAEYLARAPWDYLRTEIFPVINRDIGIDGHWTLLALYGFHLSLERKLPVRIESFSWSEIRPFAEGFLDHLLNNRNFDKIIVGGYFYSMPDSVTPIMMAEAYSEYELLLQICNSFGVKDQIDQLNRALSSYERSLNDPKAILEWPHGRGKGFSGPTHERAVKSFRELKRDAIGAMAARSRSS